MKKQNEQHETTEITIKQAEVDLLMVPIVKYINSFEGLTTRWCCQGDEKNDGSIYLQGCYVIFYSDDNISLIKLLAKFKYLARFEIEYYTESLGLRYCMIIKTKRNFDEIVKIAERELKQEQNNDI